LVGVARTPVSEAAEQVANEYVDETKPELNDMLATVGTLALVVMVAHSPGPYDEQPLGKYAVPVSGSARRYTGTEHAASEKTE